MPLTKKGLSHGVGKRKKKPKESPEKVIVEV